MSWMGTLFGGGVGFLLGGPIGAVLGAVVANRIGGGGSGPFSQIEQKQSIFFTATFAMLGQLSKADGRVSEAEIAVVEQVMRNTLKLDDKARGLLSIFLTKPKMRLQSLWLMPSSFIKRSLVSHRCSRC